MNSEFYSLQMLLDQWVTHRWLGNLMNDFERVRYAVLRARLARENNQ